MFFPEVFSEALYKQNDYDKKKVKKQLWIKLKQNISRNYKDGAVTYYPHGLQPTMTHQVSMLNIFSEV